jgi:hypothetical protein
MKKEKYPKYITKVNIKPKYTTSENISYYALSFGACFLLLYALCYTLTLIDKITL